MACNGVAGWAGMIAGFVEGLADCAGYVGRAAGSVGRAAVFVGLTVGCVGTTAGSVGRAVELVVALFAAEQQTDQWISGEWTSQEVHLQVAVGA